MRSLKILVPAVSLVVLAGLGAGRLWAESPPAPSGGGGGPGVINVVRVYDECDQIKDLNALLRDDNSGFQKESETRQKALATKETELNAYAPGTPEYETHKKELTRMTIEFNVWRQATLMELQRDHFNWTTVVYDELVKASEEVARERGFHMVVQKRGFQPDQIGDQDIDKLRAMIHARGVVWADETLDVTDSVIKKMNARYRERGGRTTLTPGKSRPGASIPPATPPAGKAP